MLGVLLAAAPGAHGANAQTDRASGKRRADATTSARRDAAAGERETRPSSRAAETAAKRPSAATRADRAAAKGKRGTASFDFDKTPMVEAVSLLQRVTGLNIILDTELARANPRLTLRVTNMRLGSALRWICELADAEYVLMDQAIYIVPKNKRRQRPQTIVVDVRDLTRPVRNFPGPRITIGDPTVAGVGIAAAAPPAGAIAADLAGLLERCLRARGEDAAVEERHGRLVITVKGRD
jgi:hypothetical protein